LYQSLCFVREAIVAGDENWTQLIEEQTERLQNAGFSMDYFHVCRSSDLLPANWEDQNLVLLIAAKLGATRLIDNVYFNRQTTDRTDYLNPKGHA
jgi:pantoate--beta-alanine ligase